MQWMLISSWPYSNLYQMQHSVWRSNGVKKWRCDGGVCDVREKKGSFILCFVVLLLVLIIQNELVIFLTPFFLLFFSCFFFLLSLLSSPHVKSL
jgi:hypothetical protein